MPFPLVGTAELVSDTVVAGGEGRSVAIEGIGVVRTVGLGVEVAGFVSISSLVLASLKAKAWVRDIGSGMVSSVTGW